MSEEYQSHDTTQLNSSWSSTETIHPDLITIKNLIYNPCEMKCSQPIAEPESAEYGAYLFKVNELSIRFRVAKVTPTKVGQFVTLWERIGNGPIQPYDISDPADLFIVSTKNGNHFGQFVFPKSLLHKQGVLSEKGKGGKRAIRVYPGWVNNLNQQAKKTQNWQMKYFLETPQNGRIDLERVRMLYSLA